MISALLGSGLPPVERAAHAFERFAAEYLAAMGLEAAAPDG
ncbi:MAG TPA: hypothetical protein VKA90_00715 [Beijerinckiaceae bacterium]|nr:hypothetical protein [Beijerinckiaceae bacterium]